MTSILLPAKRLRRLNGRSIPQLVVVFITTLLIVGITAGCGANSGDDSSNHDVSTGPSPTATVWPSDRPWTADFSGPAGTPPDSSLFSYQTGGNGWGNGELETYTTSPANASLDGKGNLAITARHGTSTGADGITREWTSARLHTYERFAYIYGTLSARIKVPQGKGLWSAFWLLGTDVTTAGWPKSGEVDIMESFNDTSQVHTTLHGPDAANKPWQLGGGQTGAQPYSQAFHVYTAQRQPNNITFSIDDHVVASYGPTDLKPGQQWVFDKPMGMLLNVAVGGNWPGNPDASTPQTGSMLVDWIKFTP